MKVKDVSAIIRLDAKKNIRVSLTTRWTTKQKGHLTVSDSLLGQVIINNQSVLGIVTEILSDGSTRVGCKKLKGSRIRCGGGNNDSILEGIMLFKGLDKLSYGRSLLSNGDVDTV
jgi:hypothetical protein